MAPALAAGNSIVFKPGSNCVLSSVKMFEIFDEVGLPKGAANLILGPGSRVGDQLAAHPDVEMVTLTGSTEVGQSIMRNAASNIKKVGLAIICFEGTEHLYNIITAIKDSVDYVSIGL